MDYLYYENARLYSNIYNRRLNNKLHNINGPAVIINYQCGEKYREEYWIRGQLHNKNGPAVIVYYESGTEAIHEYWVFGSITDKIYNEKLFNIFSTIF